MASVHHNANLLSSDISRRNPQDEYELIQKIGSGTYGDVYKIKAMRSMLEPAGVQTTLRRILGDQVIMAYNVDGVQGKKSFKEHTKFYAILLEAVSNTNVNSVGPADEHIRKALQVQKRRIFKNTYVTGEKISKGK